MKKFHIILNSTVIVLCLFVATSHAQTKYRCGNSFQDKPCADGKGAALGRSSSNQNPVESKVKDTLVIDTQCSKRGDAALKIIWQRDGGALQADLLAKAISGEERDVIGNVYANRGNAINVRKKIENDCMLEKESPLAQYNRLKKSQDMTSKNEEATREQNQEKNQEQQKNLIASDQKNAFQAEKMKQQKCEGIKVQLIQLKSDMREGGNAQRMESMNAQNRALEKELRALKC